MFSRFAPSVLGSAAPLLASLLASGCATNLDKQVDRSMASIPTQAMPVGMAAHERTYGTSAHVADRAGQLQRSHPLVRFVLSPWVGGIQTVSRTENRLPAIFDENFVLDFGESTVPVSVVAARLTRLTNIPVRALIDDGGKGAAGATTSRAVLPTPIAGIPGIPIAGGNALGATTAALAVSGPPASSVSSDTDISVNAVGMKWNGRLRDFLDHLTNTLSLSWEYRDGAVVLMRLVTQSYEVATFPGAQDFNTTMGGGGSGTAGASNASMVSQATTAITQKGTLDIRQSLLRAVQELISKVPGSSATWADGSGQMLVVTSRQAQTQVREFLRKENKLLRTMVNVTFDLYSVKTSDADDKGVDWASVFQSLNLKYGVTFSTPSPSTGTATGRIGASMVWGNGATTTKAMVALLNQYGEASQHRPISITTLNGMWDTKSRLATEGYLKETVPGLSSSSGAAGAPGLKTDTITTGDQFAVLPYVQNDNTVVLRYSIGLSDLLGMFDVTTGSGATLQKVQTPRTESMNASSTIALAPGETAVITGLSRLIAKRDDTRLAERLPIVLGGTRRLAYQREHFLILVRATPL